MRNSTQRAWSVVVAATALWLSAAGCEKAGQASAHAPEKSEAHEHDGHDHHEEHEHHDEVKLSADAIARYGVRLEPVKRETLTPAFTAAANVAFNAEATAHVGAMLSGRVVEIKARQGDVVKKGDELLVIESAELGEAQSDFLQKAAALDATRPAAEFARNSYERAKSLYENAKGIALNDLQKREADQAMAQGALHSAQAAFTASRNKLRLLGMGETAIDSLAATQAVQPRYAVAAPLDGQVTEREATLGELVGPEDDALLVLADVRTLWVLADVPEARLGEIEVGSPARVVVPAAGQAAIQGKIALIHPAIDAATRAARVRIEIDNANGALRPGMFAQAEIFSTKTAGQGEPTLVVPDEAVQTVDGEPAVFVPVQGEENTFAKRTVTIGRPVGGKTPVLTGVNEGESVVVAGSFILKAELGKGEAAHEH